MSAPSVSTRNLIFGLGLIIGSTTARFRTMAMISRVSMPVVPGFSCCMACRVKRYPPGCRRTSFLRQTTTISKGTSIDPGRGVGFGAGANRKSSEDESSALALPLCPKERLEDGELGLPDCADSGAVFPPIELMDDDDELEEEVELNGIPSPGDPGEELDDVRPPGRFKATRRLAACTCRA